MRILVLGAGGPAGVNTVRALEAAGHEVWAADEDLRHLVWFDKWVSFGGPDFVWAVSEAIADYGIDYVVPQADPTVLALAQHCEQINAATVLPTAGTILLCQDKFETGWRWAKAGLRSPVFHIRAPADLDDAAEQLGWPLWIRATRGAGANGAIWADTKTIAWTWCAFWWARGSTAEFIADEYLPGRDYAWCGVYDHGRLIVSFARERLEYIYPSLAPSGRTGTPTRAVVVHDDRVNQVAEFAVETIDREWHGVACVDLREDANGYPRPTEINAGRTCTTVPLYHEVGLNVPALLAALHTNHQRSKWQAGRDPIPAGTTLHRHIDCGHIWTYADDREPSLAH